MSRRPESRTLLFAMTGLLSLFMHLPLLLGVAHLFPNTEETLEETYTVDPIEISEEELEAEKDEKQVVSMDKPEKETPPPKDAKLLDRYNQSTDKETVRKRTPGGGAPVIPTQKRRARKTKPAPPKDAKLAPDVKSRPPSEEPNDPKKGENQPSGEIARAEDPENTTNDPNPSKDAAPDLQGDPNAKDNNELPDLDPSKILPNMSNAMRPGPGRDSPIQDHLDVEEGEKDLLNRKETLYWSFFDRLKRAVQRQWKPQQVYRRRDPRGQIYGVKDRLTIVRVTLSGNGSLKEMYVSKPSGLDFLDNEAVRAFRAAQPFPNPPEGLKDHKGEIRFSFGFMFEIHGRSSRIIRYRR